MFDNLQNVNFVRIKLISHENNTTPSHQRRQNVPDYRKIGKAYKVRKFFVNTIGETPAIFSNQRAAKIRVYFSALTTSLTYHQRNDGIMFNTNLIQIVKELVKLVIGDFVLSFQGVILRTIKLQNFWVTKALTSPNASASRKELLVQWTQVHQQS